MLKLGRLYYSSWGFDLLASLNNVTNYYMEYNYEVTCIHQHSSTPFLKNIAHISGHSP